MDFSSQSFRETVSDLQEDSEELLFLTRSIQNNLRILQEDLLRVKKTLRPHTYSDITLRAKQIHQSLTILENEIQNTRKHLTVDITAIDSFSIQKDIWTDTIRTLNKLTAALMVACDWQSPSYRDSLYSAAGKQAGQIIGTYNDYKRDQHLDARGYEESFIHHAIDGRTKWNLRAYLTSSGMAAFTTIVQFLIQDRGVRGPILVGNASYFECRDILSRLFGDACIWIPEQDTKAVLAAIKEHNPQAIFLDSLPNAPGIPVPDIPTILKYVNKTCKKSTFFVLDNTAYSTAFQPLPYLSIKNFNLSLIVFESLNKYHQYGLDLTTAGIMWGVGKHIDMLFDYRDHLGTNIGDINTWMLPHVNRTFFDRRLKRLNRNALYITTALEKTLSTATHKSIQSISYPGLSSHPSHAILNRKFHGCYFTVDFKKPYQRISVYKRFISKIMNAAQKKHLPLHAGTSFGFSTSRIYLTSLRSTTSEPFLRVVIGTEHRIAIERLTTLFEDVVTSFT